MTLVPVVDPLSCRAHGDCAVVAPAVFRVDDTAVVIASGPPDLVMAAAEACPAVAIAVVDEATGRQLYP
jgi:ferredoxin